MKISTSVFTLIFIFLWFNCFILKATTYYVNHAAAGTNNGLSWTNAFTNLSSALSVSVNGDEIWVAQGVYKPVNLVDVNASGGSDAREATFSIPDGVKLYGGFVGTETMVNERNWQTKLTILSGDIDNNDVNLDGNNIAETSANIVGNNAYHVLYTQNVSINTWVDGFIITAGQANIAAPLSAFDPNLDGGGWFNQLSAPINASSPTLVNLTFSGNFASSEGGAWYNTPGTAGGQVLSYVTNCTFTGNKSDNVAGAIYVGSFSAGTYQVHYLKCQFLNNTAYRRGGAISMIGDQSVFDSVKFINNQVTAISIDASTLPGSGGAAVMVASNAIFTGCLFENNKATGNPTGAFEGGGGGAIHISINEPQTNSIGASEPRFVSCGFYSNTSSDNTAAWGGAVVHLNDAGILRPTYVNCVFFGNQAQDYGGAIASFTRVISPPESISPALEPLFTNCTFTNNHADKRGGAIYNQGYEYSGSELLRTRVENCILWDNSATNAGPEVYNTGTLQAAYSDIEGSGGSGAGWTPAIGTDAGNNIDDNPQFFNAALPKGADNIPANNDDGLKLSGSSPAVNAGNNSASGLTGITQDYTGNLRIRNSVVDMGAYERAGIIIPELYIYWLKDCRFDPPCLSCPKPWSFIFFERIFQQFTWDGPAQLVDEGSSATISGKIRSITNKKAGFEVRLVLENGENWENWNAKQRTYYAVTPEAWRAAFKNHQNWKFWTLSEQSYLKGFGAISGTLSLKHAPSNYYTGFQLGQGANAMDKDFGAAGAFLYAGNLKYNGKRISIKGVGSMNVDATLCTENCQPMDVKSEFAEITKEVPEQSDNDYGLYPVPATDYVTISSRTGQQGNALIKLYSADGQLQKQDTWTNNDEKFTLAVKGLKPGLYFLKITLQDGKTFNKKLVIN